MAMRPWGLVLVGLAGCGGWLTPVPTYWDPVPTPHPEGLASEELSEPAVVARVPDVPERLAPPKAPEPPPPAPPDVDVTDKPPECLSVYVIGSSNNLYAYDPRESAFELRGTIDCPDQHWGSPFSMAVSKEGIAHVLFTNGRLYRVDVDDASCEATPYQANQAPGFLLFGMGYAPSDADEGESLYVAQIDFDRPSRGLARIDTDTYTLEPIGRFSQNPGFNIELTPTGGGALHGYFINASGRGGTLVSIDTTSGKILDSTALPVGSNSSALALSWWGGAFYIFTTVAGGTSVSRYDPEADTTSVVANISDRIVGAGASTCAPDRTRRSEANALR
jgi:hypothetical protein